MALFTFRLPDIGEGISEAEIVGWHVKVGDRVEEDQPIADMMTDKATVEMESPVAGVVTRLAGEVGDQIAIGAMLVEIEVEGEAEAAGGERPSEEEIAAETPGAGEIEPHPLNEIMTSSVRPEPVEGQDGGFDKLSPNGGGPAGERVLASPAVRARAKDLGIDLAQVKASGDHIRHSDLDAFLLYRAGQGYRPAGQRMKRADEVIKVIGLRRRIAENMAASKRHIPHFSYVEEIDVTELERMRAQLNGERGDRPKLTMLPLLIAALCRALPDFPMLNARYDGEAGVVTRFGAVHLGIATQTDAGLMAPVIRDAQDMNIWQLASEIRRLADAARSGKAKAEELSGSTLTLTSLGALGGVATTPVINRPEVAIIGPNRVIERPVFRGREVVPAKLMNLSISCDHRVVDGWDAANFVQAVKRLLEMPVLLFAD
ncbi:Branched-chain alpha-keto acid dehydrogenase subunit E2 [Sphingobium herbicidovorans NBRC 16415]|uniref:Dihydrolipoamide acetyltransferase component of pyruvate dehydrogenase complex n=1 Tax=Sphingobium herbicidovorans (strain ATCC 700291 / DSM 11019 / CCUG 56400 / KCTC 2939 / LMG 18315 / NBRC 16415 / MH) TaxID=1219045 RepID=A0A086PCI4_SPHHM|nr:dihydrolipoamide acetyltransferase family protein [Sphingobium herbicidovorans]KFG91102.1 Branched-chain alpha-keto acid dehydrogenase subunit E2 [Sphingobium herbicidovorans NBRC 16415]